MATYRFGLASLGGVNLELDILAGSITADDLGAELEVHALLLQQLLSGLGDLSIHTGTADLVEEFDDSNLGAESGPDGTHLQTDDTAANDDHLLGNLLEGQSTSTGDDTLLIDLEAGERGGLATGSNEDILAGKALLAAVVQVDLDLVFVDEGTGALDVLDAVLLKEEFDTLGQAGNGGILGLHHILQVELDIADFDTAVLGVVKDLVIEMGVVEKRLGRNAADVETSSSESAALLNTSDF